MARKKKHEEEEKLERWLVSYADFITLLFAFFTVLFALSQSDKAKMQEAAQAIQRAFLSSGGIFPLKGSPLTGVDKAPDKGSPVPPTPKDVGKFAKQEQEKMERVREQLTGLFEKATGMPLNKGDLEVLRTEGGFKIRMNEALLYKPGGSRIKRDYIPFLYEIGKRLARTGYPVTIEGHSDQASREKNSEAWHLSLERSTNVVKFLVEATQFPQDKISVMGYGDTKPIATNDTPEGRARNRRVEIAVMSGSEKISDIPW